MSFEAVVGIISLLVVLIILATLIYRKRPKRVKAHEYTSQWKDIQKLCPDKTTWPRAVIEADELLDDAIKKKRFKGGSMGERLVDAQKVFTDNDGVWYAHKLRKKVESEPDYKLKKEEVKKALTGIRQGLKDLGAL